MILSTSPSTNIYFLQGTSVKTAPFHHFRCDPSETSTAPTFHTLPIRGCGGGVGGTGIRYGSLASLGRVSSTRMLGPSISGPNAQIDRAARRSQSYLAWKNSPKVFLSHSMLTCPAKSRNSLLHQNGHTKNTLNNVLLLQHLHDLPRYITPTLETNYCGIRSIPT